MVWTSPAIARRILDARLRVGDAQLERPVPDVRTQIPPEERAVGEQAARLGPSRRTRRSRPSAGRPAARRCARAPRAASAGSSRARCPRPRRTASSPRPRRPRAETTAARCRRRASGRRRRRRRGRAGRRERSGERPSDTRPRSSGSGRCRSALRSPARTDERPRRPRRAGRRAPAAAACAPAISAASMPAALRQTGVTISICDARSSRWNSGAPPSQSSTSSFAGARSSVSGETSISSSSTPTVPSVVPSNAAMQSSRVSRGVWPHLGPGSRSSGPGEGPDSGIAAFRSSIDHDRARTRRGRPRNRPATSPHRRSARVDGFEAEQPRGVLGLRLHASGNEPPVTQPEPERSRPVRRLGREGRPRERDAGLSFEYFLRQRTSSFRRTLAASAVLAIMVIAGVSAALAWRQYQHAQHTAANDLAVASGRCGCGRRRRVRRSDLDPDLDRGGTGGRGEATERDAGLLQAHRADESAVQRRPRLDRTAGACSR